MGRMYKTKTSEISIVLAAIAGLGYGPPELHRAAATREDETKSIDCLARGE